MGALCMQISRSKSEQRTSSTRSQRVVRATVACLWMSVAMMERQSGMESVVGL
jgi:hypothetical protein